MKRGNFTDYLKNRTTFEHYSQMASDHKVDISPCAAVVSVIQPIEHGQDLKYIQQCASDPDRKLHAKGDRAAFLDLALHILVVSGTFELPIGQITAQTTAIEYERRAAQHCI